ncbi:MAG: polynucleotide adenylyltransferase PcnB [Proteobacteria bacterium]|nr:polynucleotide adenylyltransferase PcnB [Pseudomonadota bacterium]
MDEQNYEVLQAPLPSDVMFSHQIVKHAIPTNMLDPDAVKVVRRLSRFGYDAYLVGGCIRDILFGRQPKDFDVATSALPIEVRRLFRNCRLIGRRFRLAHLLFKQGKIIEVATFRRSATEEDDISGRHAEENLFGGPADDAIRRDFTINALMYDVVKKEIHDYVGGLGDIEMRVLKTIGDPFRRFSEDPVRIIRAAKFSVRLDLTIAPEVREAMNRHAPLIVNCSTARLVEEVFKLLRSGSSAKCFELLHETGVLSMLMPELARRTAETENPKAAWQVLEQMDTKILEGQHVAEATMLTALIHPFCCRLLVANGDVAPKLEEALEKLFHPMKFTKRHMNQVRQILMAQRRLTAGPVSRRARKLLDREYSADALDLMELTSQSEKDRELLAAWLKAFANRKRSQSQQSNSHPERNKKREKPGRPPPGRHRPRQKKEPAQNK